MPAGTHRVPPWAPRGRISLDRDALSAWGEHFGAAARAPLVVAIAGDLGSGKTTLVQAICRGYGVKEPVTSPTYALVHQYSSPRSTVYHIDLYRLDGPADLTALAWDDIMADRALVLVEWPERAGDRLPEHVPIALEHDPANPDHRILLAG